MNLSLGHIISVSVKIVWSLILAICISSCHREYTAKHINKVPEQVAQSDEYLAKQSIEITNDNIDNKDNRLKRSSKRSEKEQKRLNELNKAPYKVKTKKINDRKYDIY